MRFVVSLAVLTVLAAKSNGLPLIHLPFGNALGLVQRDETLNTRTLKSSGNFRDAAGFIEERNFGPPVIPGVNPPPFGHPPVIPGVNPPPFRHPPVIPGVNPPPFRHPPVILGHNAPARHIPPFQTNRGPVIPNHIAVPPFSTKGGPVIPVHIAAPPFSMRGGPVIPVRVNGPPPPFQMKRFPIILF